MRRTSIQRKSRSALASPAWSVNEPLSELSPMRGESSAPFCRGANHEWLQRTVDPAILAWVSDPNALRRA